MSKLSKFVRDNALWLGVGAAAVFAAGLLLRDAFGTDSAFKEEEEEDGSTVTEEPVADPAIIEHIIEAVRRANVDGEFTKSSLIGLYTECVEKYGGDSLNFPQFAEVMGKLGITDPEVVRSSFNSWDSNRDGSVDFSELLHALAIATTGSMDEKLEMMFRAYDLNNDGVIRHEELTRFYQSTLRAIGVTKSPEEIQRLVAQVFNQFDTNHDGALTAAEFIQAAKLHRFMLDEDVFVLFTRLMQASISAVFASNSSAAPAAQ